MAVPHSRERSGYYPYHGLRLLEKEAPPLSPLGIKSLKLTGDDLRSEGVAGILVDTRSPSLDMSPKFFGSEQIIRVEGVMQGPFDAVKFFLQDPDGVLTNMTFVPFSGRVELILQGHLPKSRVV